MSALGKEDKVVRSIKEASKLQVVLLKGAERFAGFPRLSPSGATNRSHGAIYI